MGLWLDDRLRDHGKWIDLTPRQRGLLVEVWLWCSAQRSDGHIPEALPKRLGVARADVARFEELGWWDRNGGSGWMAHDWHEWNPPTDPGEREKWMRRRRQRRQYAANSDGGSDA